MSKQLINQYYNQRDNLKRVGVTNEMAIKQPFDNLLLNLASSKHYVYATEVTIKNENGKNVRPDGILMNELRIHKGYVESKDTNDTLDEEINKKLYKDGYPKTNIIFQDSIFAVLIQNNAEVSRIEMADADKLEKILLQFINYKPEYIEKFDEALNKFKEDIPTIVDTLRNTISEEFKTNKKFVAASEDFFEMCQKEINPQITKEDIREMIIQHILTEDLFKSVFDESDFHHENNIASQLEDLVNTFMSRSMRQNQLGELGHYYKTLNAQAALVSDHHEKQKFLKVVYENFYKVYNPKGADKLGVVYTPNEIVRFMVQSTDYLLQKHFNKQLADKNVHILDPATGTGTFITDIIDYIPSQYLEHKYKHEIFANEVAILPYYVANLNIEYTYKQKMGKYEEFPNSCFVDTMDNIFGFEVSMGKRLENYKSTGNLFALSSENSERIQRQNEQKISVIIGNPPYNANQANFNDFNKNREYKFIDKRIKDTYVKKSTAQKTKVYDMYARFYRWASDRVDENGVVCMVTNNSFVNSKTFDGFRKCIQDEFDFCYVVDLGGNIRELSGKDGIFLGEAHTVFGIGAMVGIAIMFLVKSKEKLNKNCQIKYIHPCDIRATRIEKFEWLKSIQSFGQIPFDTINPDKNNNWVNISNNDFDDLLPIADKKDKNVIFSVHSNGVSTNRDEWVFDFDKKNLENKAKFISEKFNQAIKDNIVIDEIKWSRDLKNKLSRKTKSKFDKKYIVEFSYRPYTKQNYYSERLFSDVITQNHYDYFGANLDIENVVICYNSNEKNFIVLASNKLPDLHFVGDTKIFALNRFENKDNKIDNITQWGLSQFISYYQDTNITKEDIFHYTYAVLHHPEYRKKYELNLKREFPRLPFYDDFFKWAALGKQLMELHINYETVAPFDLQVIDNTHLVKDKNYKLKVKLKADKVNNVIAIDEHTYIHGIPESAWLYKLGNRSALEWVLDQYKEKKYTDKTIAEKFNTYRFANYKNHVIDLLKRVCTVSLETMKIIEEMK
jgi:predicted helicase